MKRKFPSEFYEGAFKTYTLEKKLETVKHIVEFVHKSVSFKLMDRAWLGQDSDIEKAARYLNLLLLYKHSKYISSYILFPLDKFDWKLFEDWLANPNNYNYYQAPRPKILGLIERVPKQCVESVPE